jgi:hypothetical protein
MKKKIALGITFCLTVSFVLQAISPAQQDTVKKNGDGVELRGWYMKGQLSSYTRLADTTLLPPGSIYVDRDPVITNYSPTDLVRRIFLKSYTPADMERIRNVRHVGWNWNPVTQQKVATPASAPEPGGSAVGWWGDANTGIAYDSNERSLLYFTKGTASLEKFDLEKGLLLTTGPGLRAEGPNKTHHGMSDGFRNDGIHGRHTAGYSGNSISVGSITSPKHKYRPGDSGWIPGYSFDRDLDGLTGDDVAWTTCGSVLEFDFQPAVGRASFNYIFASDEYPEGVYLANDVFGFFVSGPFDEPSGHDIESPSAQWSIENPTVNPDNEYKRIHDGSVYYRYNIARLPDNNPVGINYINWGSITEYWCEIVPYNCGSAGNTYDEFYKDNPSLSPAYGSYKLPQQLQDDPYAQLSELEAFIEGYKYVSIPSGALAPTGNVPVYGGGTYYYAVPTNPHLFRYNYQDDPTMEYDGYTFKLQAVADKLVPGKWYHLKLAVANTAQRDPGGSIDFDRNHGSGVFLADLDLGKVEGNMHYPYRYEVFDDKGVDENGNDFLFSHEDPEKVCADCGDYEMILHFDSTAAENLSTVFITYINIDPAAVQTPDGKKAFAYSSLYKSDTLQLTGKSDTLRNYEVKLFTDYPGFVNGQYVGIIISLQGGNMDTIFYGPLYRHAAYSPVFRSPSTMYAGQMALNTQYGSPQLHRSLNGGVTWELASEPFQPWEIMRIAELRYILLREPNSGYIIDTIKIREPAAPTALIRTVVVPDVADVTTIPGPGVYRIPSRDDFVLTVIPNPNSPRANLTPVISTDRKLLPDIEGTSMSSMRDGSYIFTIYRIQEPVKITIEFPSAAGAGTAANSHAIWASGRQLHIVSPESGVATVYTLTGTVFKTVPHTGGNATTTALPAGVYIVSFNGKNHKVLVNRE